MSILHVVNKSPFEKTSLDSCLMHAKEGAAILFIEDGIYAAFSDTVIVDKMKAAIKSCDVYALEADIKARGMDVGKVISGIKVVNYGDFVDLVVAHDGIHSWV
uniref:tRNA 2-thiouridine synthesizing protein B n=1 Tax=Candidatus Kentrum sp. TUN TaxID=2126343 RepID=A0A450ZC75_9GAMM|nr:MAG: tRNA 2-thiouridine synthesizing protein B [Candidatus Kentron sp. TUN]VFK50819.1 MAG: tRNA 2-thiouridine synthesizing protein B [Candidatus Kentron sp. TUN]VFK51258.1 MAG: tRNA 2-thiouridine synthesizing protein B [Candidatus Kentron sp. TUN]